MSFERLGEITAVATAVLAIFAIVTAFYAVRAFRKQSHEVGILAAQNERDSSDRRRAQASRVFIWTEPTSGPDPQTRGAAGIITRIKNTSQQPIYDGSIGCRDGSGRTVDNPVIPAFPVLMPGEQRAARYREYLRGTCYGRAVLGGQFPVPGRPALPRCRRSEVADPLRRPAR